MEPEVVIAVVQRADGRVLMIRRKQSEGNLKWSFPGGKINPSESEPAASRREVEEEVGVLCSPLRKIGQWSHPDTKKIISYWLCNFVDGVACVREPDKIDEVAWLTSEQIQQTATSTIFPKILSTIKARRPNLRTTARTTGRKPAPASR